jgi:hypothetical protein
MNEEFLVGFPHYIQKRRHDVIMSVCTPVSFEVNHHLSEHSTNIWNSRHEGENTCIHVPVLIPSLGDWLPVC